MAKMNTPYRIYFPQKPQHADEVVIKFKLMENNENASFKFCTAAGKTQRTHQLEIELTKLRSKLKLTCEGMGEKQENEIDNQLVLNREVIYTLVFRLFDGNHPSIDGNQTSPSERTEHEKKPEFKIEIFLERTQANSINVDMPLQVNLDQLHYVELGGAFEYVKALMFRFNDGRPANDQARVPVGECKCNCAWCTCCVNPK